MMTASSLPPRCSRWPRAGRPPYLPHKAEIRLGRAVVDAPQGYSRLVAGADRRGDFCREVVFLLLDALAQRVADEASDLDGSPEVLLGLLEDVRDGRLPVDDEDLLQENRLVDELLLQTAFARLGEDLVGLAGVLRIGLGLRDVDRALVLERFLRQILDVDHLRVGRRDV